eukprot:m.171556 g.171556  ORF g.171556 m.171556 type:complete len:95 (+) comp39058_c0_seq10:365-649(+)
MGVFGNALPDVEIARNALEACNGNLNEAANYIINSGASDLAPLHCDSDENVRNDIHQVTPVARDRPGPSSASVRAGPCPCSMLLVHDCDTLPRQ